MSFYRTEVYTSRSYWFRKKDGTKFSQDFRSTTDAIDYAKRYGYEFLGTHSNEQLNHSHPNYYN